MGWSEWGGVLGIGLSCTLCCGLNVHVGYLCILELVESKYVHIK